MITRRLEQDLLDWKASPTRKPLLIRGARQVGKSFLVESFGRQYFENIVVINFELEPEHKQAFENLNPQNICNTLRITTKQLIEPGKTLIFLDEIQDCPKAIQALRYFKEKMPEQHVIGAGSLLELALRKADFRMPVGRVQFYYLYPLSFKEFLSVVNPQSVAELEQATLTKPLAPALHNYFLEQLKLYTLLGGMPEAVSQYLQNENLQKAQATQNSILETYLDDFGHYASYADIKYLTRCFTETPKIVGQQIKYNKIDPDVRSRELKQAIQTLEDVNLLQRIHATKAQGLPLDAATNEKKFKLNFVDIGLVKRSNQLDASVLMSDDIMLVNKGALAEQLVGQELLANSPSYERTKLYFWARDGQGIAEVDYVITSGTNIVPVEVKSGKVGVLRSLKQFMLERSSSVGVRISQQELKQEGNILSVPLYMISELPRLLLEA